MMQLQLQLASVIHKIKNCNACYYCHVTLLEATADNYKKKVGCNGYL
ncbi:MAG: hypothetical protein ACK4FV_07605 [Candidatus Nitrosocaldus sp.]